VDETEETFGNNTKNTEESGGGFMNLINLNVIAEKAREEKQRRLEMMKSKRDEKKLRPIPFYIDWVIKEDLETVMKT
jgi:hypothetical protein